MTMGAPREGVARIALDVPLRRLFDYLIPADMVVPLPGSRVRVPFGRRRLIGVVIENAFEFGPAARTPEAPDRIAGCGPILDAEVLGMVRWASDYYHHPIGEVVASALPRACVAGASPVALVRLWRPTPSGREALAQGHLGRSRAQREMLELLVEHDPIPQDTLALRLPRWRPAAGAMLKHGWARWRIGRCTLIGHERGNHRVALAGWRRP